MTGTKLRAGSLHMAHVAAAALDFIIALARKVAGFTGLLVLGWTYFRLLILGDTTRTLYPSAADPDLRQTLWVALLLIMAQGWDIPTDRIALFWNRLTHRLPKRPSAPAIRLKAPDFHRAVEPIIITLGRFMDLCVAIANKIGAFAVFVYLFVLGGQIVFAGATPRQLYPDAADPAASMLADFCVYLVVLGWWATPFEQIGLFWSRLRAPIRAEADA